MADKYRIREKKDWIWDETTHQQALASMRTRLVAKLKWSFKMPNAKLVRPIDDLETKSCQAACVLHLQSPTSEEGPFDNREASEHVLRTRGRADLLPQFYLLDLLGSELTRVLVEGTQFATSVAVTLTTSHLTASARVELMRLETFLRNVEI